MPNFIFLPLLGFLVIFSCLAYGSVTIFPLTVIEIVIGLFILSWLLEMAAKKQLSFVKTGFFLPIAFFLVVVSFQLVPLPLSFIKLISYNSARLYETLIPGNSRINLFPLSICPNSTISELLKLISFIGIFFFIINKIERKKDLDIAINFIIFFGLLVSIYALIKKFAYPERIGFGPFVNRNNFAGYINMIIPLALGYFLTDMPLSKRLVYAFSVAIMTLALFLTLSRAGILVYILVLLLILFFSRFKKTLKTKTGTLIIWALTTVCLFILFLEANIVWQRLITLLKKETYIVFGHGYSWLDVLRIWRDFPIFGTGLGTFRSISSMYKTTTMQYLFTYAHNDYLQLLSEVGFIGFFLIALFFLKYFKSITGNWLKRQDSFVTCLVLGGVSSIIGTLVYSVLDFNLQIPANTLLFFIIMGLVYRLTLLRVKNAES